MMNDKRARMHRALDAVLDANPDGSISADEPRRTKALLASATQEMNQLIARCKREANEIGGGFRSPGICAQLRAALLPIVKSL